MDGRTKLPPLTCDTGTGNSKSLHREPRRRRPAVRAGIVSSFGVVTDIIADLEAKKKQKLTIGIFSNLLAPGFHFR